MVLGSEALKDVAGMTGPASIDMTLSDTILVPRRKKLITLGDRVNYKKVMFSKDKPFILRPGGFVLAATVEHIALGNDKCGFVQGRSSIGRIGLTVQNAGFIDPGFNGTITLELVNESKSPIALVPGYRVVQVVLMDVRDNDRPYEGKYNGQKLPTGSRMFLDDEVEHG